jgi:hypothetical protein
MAGTFDVEVPDIGVFTFAHRRMKDQFRIEAVASRLLGGPVDDEALKMGAAAFATLSVLTVHAPDGWNLDDLDPLDGAATMRLFAVHGALREAEGRFRGGPADNGAAVGA